MSEAAAAQGGFETPGLLRRLACFLYEGVLLFGIVMATGLVYALATGQRDAMKGQHGLQALLFAVIGAYFVWFWTRSGQTLAMKTWHIRLLGPAGRPVGSGRALVRYLLAWIWFLPALAAVHFSGLKSGWQAFGTVFAGVLVYAATSLLQPQRQYWHDAACGTRLVDSRPR